MKKICMLFAIFVMAVGMCGCSENNSSTVTEELQGLAKIEVYATDETLLSTIEDEESLIKFNQLCSVDDASYSEEEQAELIEEVNDHALLYTIVAYKKPVAKFGDKELQKSIIIEVYEDTDIVKVLPVLESLENSSILEGELNLSWYERTTEEGIEYFHMLAGE